MDNQGYYTSVGRKIGDFCIGFFGFWIINSALFGIINFLVFGTGVNIPSLVDDVIGIGGSILIIMLDILAIIYFFIKKRRFISIGMISSFAIPFLLVGACFLIIMGFSKF
ncbi:MAG: hypothetical protein JW867_08635 [Candidatus Omnitrophica bacterium]|nr:hypothetical protein [Candidatus Omnitrophota bacterium]